MKKADADNLPLGLYRVWWKSGGSSLASVGMTSGGSRWLAPANWVEPATEPDWDAVLKMERINVPTAGQPGFWRDHIAQARELLTTVLDETDAD